MQPSRKVNKCLQHNVINLLIAGLMLSCWSTREEVLESAGTAWEGSWGEQGSVYRRGEVWEGECQLCTGTRDKEADIGRRKRERMDSIWDCLTMGQGTKEERGYKWLWGLSSSYSFKGILVPLATAYTASFASLKLTLPELDRSELVSVACD